MEKFSAANGTRNVALFGLLLLLQLSLSSAVLTWACSNQDIVSNSSCLAVLGLNATNGKSYVISNWSNKGYDFAAGYATDPASQTGYLILGYNANQTLSVAVIDLNSGSTVKFFSNSWQLGSSSDTLLDVFFNQARLYALVQRESAIPSLSSLELVSVDASSGKVLGSIAKLATRFTIFISSSFDSSSNMLYAILANQTGFQFFAFNIAGKSVTQFSSPYGFIGTVFDKPANQILGTVAANPVGENTFALLNPKNGSLTLLNSKPYEGYVCGAVIHSGFDPIGSSYFTLCCEDKATCSDPSISQFRIPSGDLVLNATLAYVQRPTTSGFNWI